METTNSELFATAPPHNPVRPPEGTTFKEYVFANKIISCSCFTDLGKTTAFGFPSQIVVLSTP